MTTDVATAGKKFTDSFILNFMKIKWIGGNNELSDLLAEHVLLCYLA